MAATWACPACQTVNASDAGQCMVCATKAPLAAAPTVVLNPRPPVMQRPPPASGVTPRQPARPRRSYPRRSRARSVATGPVLGAGHIGLFAVASFLVLFSHSWGGAVLRRTWHPGIYDHIESWGISGLMDDAAKAVVKLAPDHTAAWIQALAVACLAVRLLRFLPGWLTLLVSVAAALAGALTAVAYIPVFGGYWTLTIGLVVGSLVIVAATRSP